MFVVQIICDIFLLITLGASFKYLYKAFSSNGFKEERGSYLLGSAAYGFLFFLLLMVGPNPLKFQPDTREDITESCDISHNSVHVVALCEPDIHVSEDKEKLIRELEIKKSGM